MAPSYRSAISGCCRESEGGIDLLYLVHQLVLSFCKETQLDIQHQGMHVSLHWVSEHILTRHHAVTTTTTNSEWAYVPGRVDRFQSSELLACSPFPERESGHCWCQTFTWTICKLFSKRCRMTSFSRSAASKSWSLAAISALLHVNNQHSGGSVNLRALIMSAWV